MMLAVLAAEKKRHSMIIIKLILPMMVYHTLYVKNRFFFLSNKNFKILIFFVEEKREREIEIE